MNTKDNHTTGEGRATAEGKRAKRWWVRSRRAGGGPWRANMVKGERKAENPSNPLLPWNNWLGPNAGFLANILTENTVGGALAPSTRRAYNAAWKEWGGFRKVRQRTPFLDPGPLTALSEEQDVLTYCSLLTGPMLRKTGTLRLRLQAIGFFHRLRRGINIFAHMPRIALFLKGALRAEGAPVRKLPVATDHLLGIHSALNLGGKNRQILRGVILVARFFMLRRSEYLQGEKGERDVHPSGSRRPLCDGGLLPRYHGRHTEWSQPVDEVAAHLKGSKTDWLNQGTVRNHTALPLGHPRPELCVVRALQRAHRADPARLTRGSLRGWATWPNGEPIDPKALTALLRLGDPNTDRKPGKASLHSLRAGGATALYQAAGSLGLAKRMGRWRSEAVSVYLWESHQLMAGLAGQMARGGHEIHRGAQ